MQLDRLKRREFTTLLGAVAAWPLAARAQQTTMPVIGFLRSTPAEPFANIVVAFRQGLNETGFVEGQNVAVEQRWADNQLHRLPGLAADLVRRQVAVIVGNALAVEVARSATTTIPILFVIGDDPVTQGLVTSLNRPGGNLTGLTFFANRLSAKRFEILLELVPGTRVVAVLIDPNFSSSATELREVEEATTSAITSQLVASSATRQASPTPIARRASMPGGFSRAPSRQSFQCCSRPHSNWRSISRPPRHSASLCH
jgi:ABC-type uncharacterized transport system substrate-binding protein